MRKYKDVMYYCTRCHKEIIVAGFIAKDMVKFGKTPFCSGCSKNDCTVKFAERYKRKGQLSDPPSQGQLAFIKGLGGNPKNVKTKGEAGEIITALKKEKGLL